MNIGSREMTRKARYPHMQNSKSGPDIGTCQGAEAFVSVRRQEARVNESKVCAYSLCESIEGERVALEQGEVYSLNRSEHGIQVLMGSQPPNGQLLELHVAESRWEYSLNLYEVQWTKVISVESQGHLFLVGCRLIIGASRYWAF